MDPVAYQAALRRLLAAPTPADSPQGKLGIVDLHFAVVKELRAKNAEAAARLVQDNPALKASYLGTAAGAKRAAEVVAAESLHGKSAGLVMAEIFSGGELPKFRQEDLDAMADGLAKHQDCPALTRLLEFGVPMEQALAVFRRHGGASLLDVFAQRFPDRLMTVLMSSVKSYEVMEWAMMGMRAPSSALGNMLNAVLNAPHPEAAQNANYYEAPGRPLDHGQRENLWWTMAKEDSVQCMRRLIELDWVPTLQGGVHARMIDWGLLAVGASKAFALWMSDPALRAASMARAAESPDRIMVLVRDSAAQTKLLDAMKEAGIDFLATDEAGRTIAHSLAEHASCLIATKWFIRNVPEALDVKDEQGECAWGVMRRYEEGALLSAKFQSKKLEKAVPAAPGVRTRM